MTRSALKTSATEDRPLRVRLEAGGTRRRLLNFFRPEKMRAWKRDKVIKMVKIIWIWGAFKGKSDRT